MEAVEIIRMLTTVSTPPNLARSVGVHPQWPLSIGKVVSSAVVPIVGFVGQDFFRPLPELFIFFQPMPAEMHKTDELIQGSHFRTVGRHRQNPCSDCSCAQANGRRKDATAPED